MDQKSVPELIEEVKSQSLADVARSAEALGNIGPQSRPAVPYLIRKLAVSDKNEVQLKLIYEALQKIGLSKAEIVEGLLEEVKRQVEQGQDGPAVRTLAKFGAMAIPALLEAKEISNFADDAIATITDPAAVPILLKEIEERRDESLFVLSALSAIGKIADPESVPALIRLLKSEGRERKRLTILTEICRIGGNHAIPVLFKVFSSKGLERCLFSAALDALLKVGSPQVINRIIPIIKKKLKSRRIYSEPLSFLDRVELDEKQKAIEVAGRIGNDEFIPLLKPLLVDFWYDTSKALVNIGSEKAKEIVVPVLTSKSNSSDKLMQKLAIELIGETAGTSVVPYISSFFNDPDPNLRKVALEAVDKIKKRGLTEGERHQAESEGGNGEIRPGEGIESEKQDDFLYELDRKSPVGRLKAVQNLGNTPVSDQDVVYLFIVEADEFENKTIRETAREIIEKAQFSKEKVVAGLLDVLNNKNSIKRFRAANALALLGDEGIIALAETGFYNYVFLPVGVLKIESERVLNVLMNLLEKGIENQMFSYMVIKSIGATGSPLAVSFLRKRLESKITFMERSTIVDVLKGLKAG